MINRGSEWHKWDLHIHTPKSIVNNYGGDTDEIWEKFISALENLPNDVKVIGITDYYFIDGYEKVMEYRAKGRLKNIEKIFPILEFRIDTFGCGSQNNLQKINLHVLFNIDESNLSSDIQKVKTEFISQIPISSLDKHKTKTLSRDNLIAEGQSLKDGFSNLVPPTKVVFDTIFSETWKDKTFLFLGYVEWSNLEKNQQLRPLKEDLYSKVGAFFTSNIDNLPKSQSWLDEFGRKKLLHSLDIHDLKKLDSSSNGEYLCNTWIKADTTFEGLKQIIYEPERVRIQEENPYYDREKSPFTEICINEDTSIFPDGDITFVKQTIPLNSDLISIIGGRGTGKSRLIDYIAQGLGKTTPSTYTFNDQVIVKRKTALHEEETPFNLAEGKHVDFMYIRQSEVKEVVEDKEILSKKIRETIGVQEAYTITQDLRENITNALTEYTSLYNTLNANDTTSTQKIASLDEEIKRYADYIENITSSENKAKLEQYKSLVTKEQELKKLIEQIATTIGNITKTQEELNESIEEIETSIKNKIGEITIPRLNSTETTNMLQYVVDESIKAKLTDVTQNINRTKEEFKDYKGDLTSLLDNVKVYQENVATKLKEKETIEKNNARLLAIRTEILKNIGEQIKNSIVAYKEKIEETWKRFKAGKEGYSDELSQLLNDILSEDELDVHVEIKLDTDKMYRLLQAPLDKRSWKLDYLKEFIGIRNIVDYFNYITQIKDDNGHAKIEELVNEQLDCLLLPVFLKDYTQYITHNIIVSSHNRPITKLSHGQQGTIYLRIQLAANLAYNTIIYDQPEDDLDNDFITNSLVELFRKIKKYRQVIIVSHNANLVVNADSEQVIVAHNEEGRLTYECGSLENPIINKAVCKILEGGKAAFEKREQRYGLR